MTVDSSLTARSDEAARYVDGVAAHLADLPDEDRADLLDELAAHVDELVAEGDTPLADRLGSPAEYAAELRASAGLPPARSRGRTGAQALDRLQRIRARFEARRAEPSVNAVEEFVRSLRPAWWVLRGWVLVALGTWYAHPHWWHSLVIVPDVGPDALSLLVLALAVLVSVQLGRHGRFRTASAAWAMAVVNLVAAIGLWPVLLMMNEAYHQRYSDPVVRVVQSTPPEGVYAAGHQVWNIYAYDASGRMLHDVRLFDQSGRPLSLGLSADGTRRVVVDAQGRLVENAFPYRYLEPDGTVAHPDAGPTVSAPPLGGAAAASPAPSPSASPTGGKR
jgi:HAAS domain-containing protein